MSDWIDISVPLRTGMPYWPGTDPVIVERALDMERGDVCNLSKITIGIHNGTHMDAPLHFTRTGNDIETLPLSATIGIARVIEIKDPESIKPEELLTQEIQADERILFKTTNSARCWQTDAFVPDFVYISEEAATFLAAQRIKTVGVDYLSVAGFRNDSAKIHNILLQANIWIIEGLNLSQVPPGSYELICLPLRIEHTEGSPARAILRAI